jgi:hypothetical protein
MSNKQPPQVPQPQIQQVPIQQAPKEAPPKPRPPEIELVLNHKEGDKITNESPRRKQT